MTSGIADRRPYQGLLEIFGYNWRFYACTLAGVIAAVFLSGWLPSPLRTLVRLASGTALFWTCSSLVISHYVYDRSALHSFRWLHGSLSREPVRWLNIHSGVDGASGVIGSLFPDSQRQVLDIYDPREMTEPSIEQARRMTPTQLSDAADWRALPASDQEFDAAFLIFAAHELRCSEARVQLLQEVSRVLSADGELILVEHLRDWANFLAFGPGFLHFFSGRTWRQDANAAGFRIRLHRTITPFVHVFVLQRPS